MSVNETITPVAYRKKTIADRYNELTVTLNGGYAVLLRAYDDGVAYRLVLDRTGDVTVKSESANFNFAGDYTAHVPPGRRKLQQGRARLQARDARRLGHGQAERAPRRGWRLDGAHRAGPLIKHALFFR